MAYRTDDHSDDTLFKNRLWKLMEKEQLKTAGDLARKLYETGMISYKPRPRHDEGHNRITLEKNNIASIEKQVQKHMNMETCEKLEGQYVMAYMKLFGCDANYLFGLQKCKTEIHQLIQDNTGLSEESISTLLYKDPDIQIVLDSILRQPCIYANVPEYIKELFLNRPALTKKYGHLDPIFIPYAEKSEHEIGELEMAYKYHMMRAGEDLFEDIVMDEPVFNYFSKNAMITIINNGIKYLEDGENYDSEEFEQWLLDEGIKSEEDLKMEEASREGYLETLQDEDNIYLHADLAKKEYISKLREFVRYLEESDINFYRGDNPKLF